MPTNAYPATTAAPQRVLIVEDEFAVANDLQQIVERAGYVVSAIAFTVAQALALQQQRPDLVLLDIYLKGSQTGIDLARQLNAETIPFVFVSANVNAGVLEEVKATQPAGFLVKPFREKDVLVALEIAHYRHAHGEEARLRREQALQLALLETFAEPTDWRQQCQQVARLFQTYIPFDFFSLDQAAGPELVPFRSYGFFRVGQEYQTIQAEDLLRMTGLTPPKYQALRAQAPGQDLALFNGPEFEETLRKNPLKQLLAKTFRLQSHAVLPLQTAHCGTYYLCFFSRQPQTYQPYHLRLLRQLQPSLTLAVDRLMAFGRIEQLSEQLRQENTYLLEEVKTGANYEEIIGESPLLRAVYQSVKKVAPTDYTVLILGETGTDKELIARVVHGQSVRRSKTLIKVNCATLPPQLIESELFGHEKGSFTGATDKRIGKFELAHGGTIFLDEIGELPLELQPKLLRVLQEGEIERIGGSGPIASDVRIIAATNRDLTLEVSAGRFRADLFYRLNVFPIHLPPLRDRLEDLPLLLNYFLEKIAKKLGKQLTGVSADSLRQMRQYAWPGNIRELKHLLERAAIMTLTPEVSLVEPLVAPTLPHSSAAEEPSAPVVKSYLQAERDNVLAALQQTNYRIWGRNGAAELLGIKPTTLESRMLRLGIYKSQGS